MKQKIIIALGIALVVGLGIYVYTQNRNNADTTNNLNMQNNEPQEGDVVGNEVPSDPDEDPQTPTSDTIAVSTQTPGDSVTIDNVFLSKAGFITIHETDAKGMAGTIVGTSGLLSVGAKQDLQVAAVLKSGAKYIAMVRADNGDKKFNANQDAAILNNGVAVMIMFSVSQ